MRRYSEKAQRDHLTRKGKEVKSAWACHYDREYLKEEHNWDIARHDFGNGDYHYAIENGAVCAECGAPLPKDDAYRKGIEQGRIFAVWKIISKYENYNHFAIDRDMDVWHTCSIDCAISFRNKNRIDGVGWLYSLTTAVDVDDICDGYNPMYGYSRYDTREPAYYGGSPGLGKRR